MTKKEMQKIVDHTAPELVGKYASIHDHLGKYVPSGANGAYWAGWTREGQLVVTRFQFVVGGKL